MQRLYEVGFPSDEHIPALKKLWADVFNDEMQIIDNFFENTQNNANTICAFYEGVPVSMLFAIEGEIFIKPKKSYTYKYTGLEEGSWSYDSRLPIEANINNNEITIKWTTTYTG